jgi:site-specific recombinase XerD
MTKRTGRAVAERVASVAKTSGKKLEKAMKRNFVGPLSREEVKALLEVAKDIPFQEAIVTILLHTGLRIGELQSLKLKDIDLRGKTVTVINPKTGDSRTIPICDAVCSILAKLMDYRVVPRGKGNAAFIPREAHQTYVFCDGQGEPCPRSHINFLSKLGAKAGISKRLSHHHLRQTFAVVLREHLSVYEVAKLMGYKTIHS